MFNNLRHPGGGQHEHERGLQRAQQRGGEVGPRAQRAHQRHHLRRARRAALAYLRVGE